MSDERPRVVVLAGPNGAGKSTCAKRLLLGPLAVDEFVNADTIAAGLSAFAPERVALEAGRVMLTRLRELAAARASFAFETTLATRSYASWLQELRAEGYVIRLVFIYLPDAAVAVDRVAARVRGGGHDISPQVVKRRYERGLANFRLLYRPIVDSWIVFDGIASDLATIATGRLGQDAVVYNESLWDSLSPECKRTTDG